MSDVADILASLIAVKTHNPGGDEGVLAERLAEELSLLGPDSVSVRDVPRSGATGAYVFARFGMPRLLVNAHLDTVPANQGWLGDPFVARITDGRVIGLGAADTKGSIAAILCALKAQRPRDVGILFSGDEEVSASVMAAFLASEDRVGAAIQRAIVCEPTGCKLGTRHRGILAMEVALEGEGGHSSRADHLPKPIAELSRLAVALDDWGLAHLGDGEADMRGQCMNVAAIDGGVAFNVVPQRAKLRASVRPPPGVSFDGVKATLLSLAKQHAPRARVAFPVDNPPLAARDVAGFRAYFPETEEVALQYWTEAALLSASGIDAVVFGPGEIEAAHAPEESVAIAQLEHAQDAFTRIFRESHRESQRPRRSDP